MYKIPRIFFKMTVFLSMLFAAIATPFMYSRNISRHRKRLEKILCGPEIQATLDVIAFAEGTDNDKGYQTMYGYTYFDDFSDHPRIVNCRGSRGKKIMFKRCGAVPIFREDVG